MKGFYVPGSRSGSYVSNKRDEEGSLLYETASSEAGIQKQAALQSLGENYAATIENAYASYLANQRDIRTSAMGQGYKEAYLEAQDKALVSNIAQSNLSLANARAELESQEQQAQSTLAEQYQTEVANLDRVANSMNDYLTYVKSLTGKDDPTSKYFTEEQEQLAVDDLYEQLYMAQPQGLLDEEGQAGKTYLEWIRSQLTNSEVDTNWSNWLFYQGGWQDFINSVNKSKEPSVVTADKEADKQAEEEQKAAEEKAKWYVGTATKENTSAFAPMAYTYNGKTYSAKQTIQAGSKNSAKITRALDVKNKLASGELKINDIVIYDGKYYVIAGRQYGPGGDITYQQIDYKK